MKKFRKIFSLSLQNEFTYRLNFILWRFRNILRVLMTIFLWEVVFVNRSNAFGYTKAQMLGYVFLVLVIQTLVLASPSNDNIGGEISNGDLSNYLVKPISYVRFWLTRDLASKFLNLLFATVEFGLLLFFFHPDLSFPITLVGTVTGLISWGLGIMIFFFLTKITVFAAFWTPENTWGLTFLVLVLLEVFSGAIFPLDILPATAQTVLQFTPFPYLIYFPISLFIGRFNSATAWRIIIQSSLWLLICWYVSARVWRAGLKTYSANGN